MEQCEEKKINLDSSEAYGEHNLELTRKIPRNQLPKEPKPKAGMVLALTPLMGRKYLQGFLKLLMIILPLT